MLWRLPSLPFVEKRLSNLPQKAEVNGRKIVLDYLNVWRNEGDESKITSALPLRNRAVLFWFSLCLQPEDIPKGLDQLRSSKGSVYMVRFKFLRQTSITLRDCWRFHQPAHTHHPGLCIFPNWALESSSGHGHTITHWRPKKSIGGIPDTWIGKNVYTGT